MTKDELLKIKDGLEGDRRHAEKILEGDADDYDGADGARYMKDTCNTAIKLCSILEGFLK